MLLSILFFLLFFDPCYGQSSSGFIPVKTAGKMPFLASSRGTDRLGSAKLGYLDTGIVLKAVDSTQQLYKVQLSSLHSAYIAKEDVVQCSSFYDQPYCLINNWKATGGNDCYDSLFIQLDEKVPYTSYMEINPSRIILDLYGVQSNTNWITQSTQTLKEIKNLHYTQEEDDKVRIVITLAHAQHWGYSTFYRGNTLILLVKQQPVVLKPHAITVAIDAGHGGTNTGAAGTASRVSEKYLTLDYAKELESYLKEKQINTLMTRYTDSSFGNTDRIKWLQEKKPDILISLHFNSSANDSVRGTGTFYKSVGFRPLSLSVLNRMLETGMAEYANVGNFNFLLNAPTDFPSVLVEIAFLSNLADEQKILSADFRKQVARQIYLGISDFLKQAE
jgi:N-acetylmuramoyl-L-alanine amidase